MALSPPALMRTTSIVVIGIGVLASGAVAQERQIQIPTSRIRTQTLPVIRGVGTPAPREMFVDRSGHPPDQLSVDDKNALLDGKARVVVDRGPWQVTPDVPYVEGRADLAYWGAYIVDLTSYEAPAAYFRSKSTWTSSSGNPVPHLGLRFRPPAPGSYLVDCRVRNHGETYEVEVYPGGKQTFAGTEHLVLLYQAMNTSTVQFLITANHPQHKAWKFYGCEVTPVQ